MWNIAYDSRNEEIYTIFKNMLTIYMLNCCLWIYQIITIFACAVEMWFCDASEFLKKEYFLLTHNILVHPYVVYVVIHDFCIYMFWWHISCWLHFNTEFSWCIYMYMYPYCDRYMYVPVIYLILNMHLLLCFWASLAKSECAERWS